jgi:hypothetical protein
MRNEPALACLLLCAAVQAADLRYWVEPCSKPESGCHSGDPELAQWALEAWQAAGAGAFTFEKTTDAAKAQIRVYWATGEQGLYGEARPIMVDGIPGAEVYVRATIVPRSESDTLLRDAIVYLTCLHETGHALGLPHTAAFADIMYSFQYGGNIPEYFARYRRQLSSRADIRKHPGLSAQDLRRAAALFR